MGQVVTRWQRPFCRPDWRWCSLGILPTSVFSGGGAYAFQFRKFSSSNFIGLECGSLVPHSKKPNWEVLKLPFLPRGVTVGVLRLQPQRDKRLPSGVPSRMRTVANVSASLCDAPRYVQFVAAEHAIRAAIP